MEEAPKGVIENGSSSRESEKDDEAFWEQLNGGDGGDPFPAGLLRRYQEQAHAEDLEIGMRRRALELLSKKQNQKPAVSAEDGTAAAAASVEEIGSFWKRCLRVCRHLLLRQQQRQQQQQLLLNNSGEAGGDGDAAATTAAAAAAATAIANREASQIAKIPFALLDDVFDGLAEPQCVAFWNEFVDDGNGANDEDADSAADGLLLFGDAFWSHPTCGLSFLKTCSKLTKRPGLPVSLVARVMNRLAAAYPLNDKSATRIWGSRNAETLADYESKADYEKEQLHHGEEEGDDRAAHAAAAASTATATTSSGGDDFYTLYESFWSLQQDFTSPFVKNLASFLLRLRTLLQAMEQEQQHHSSVTTSKTDHDKHENSMDDDGDDDPLLASRKYLTSSRLLPIQLSSPSFCQTVLLQFLLVAHSLARQAPTVGQRLAQMQDRARKLLPKSHLEILDAVQKTDDDWSDWKRTKKQPVLEKRKRSVKSEVEATEKESDTSGPPAKKRQRTQLDGGGGSPLSSSSKAANYDSHLVPSASSSKQELVQMSVQLRRVVPGLDTHLAEYIDSMDPQAGIEPEYHPKHNTYFSWQSLRLLAEEHCDALDHVLPNGDFENMVRHVYTNRGVEIPGQAIEYPQEEEDDIEEEEEEALKGEEVENAEEEGRQRHQVKGEGADHESNKESDLDRADVDMKEAEEEQDEKPEAAAVVEAPKTKEECVVTSAESAVRKEEDVKSTSIPGQDEDDDIIMIDSKKSEDRENKSEDGKEKGDRRDDDRKARSNSSDNRKGNRVDGRRGGEDRRDIKADDRNSEGVKQHQRDQEGDKHADQNGDKASSSSRNGGRGPSRSQGPAPPPPQRDTSRDTSRGGSSGGGRPSGARGSGPDLRHSPPSAHQQDGQDRGRQAGNTGGGGRDRDRGRDDRGRDPDERGRDDRDDRRGGGGGGGGGGRGGRQGTSVPPREDQRGGGNERWEERRGRDGGDGGREGGGGRGGGGGGRDNSRRRGGRR